MNDPIISNIPTRPITETSYCLLVFTFCSLAATLLPRPSLYGQSILIWPEGQMPNSQGVEVPYIETDQRIRQLDTPKLIHFAPNQEADRHTGIIICPGGGYKHMAVHKEGYQVAKWLNTLGYHAFVLQYRLPHSPDLITPHLGPLQDAQRAIKWVRHQPGIKQVGVLGFSAGGHLAASAGTLYRDDHAQIGDKLDSLSCKPDFMILVYPALYFSAHTPSGSQKQLLGETQDPEWIHYFSPEKQVDTQTPPTLLIHAHDDTGVSPASSLYMYEALLKHQVPASLVILPKGGHGFGLGEWDAGTRIWLRHAEKWLEELNK